MILDIIKTHTHNGITVYAGQKLEVTNDLGRQLIANGVAQEIKPLMLDRSAFNELMASIDKQRIIHEEEE
jgi:hypothetical protein